MALIDVIARFATGTYEVTRTAAGSYTAGRYTAGAPSTFDLVDACVQPVNGRELESLNEAEHGAEIRVIYSTVELLTRAPGQEPDSIEIDGEPWTVIRSERWQAFGGDASGNHWRAYAARDAVP